MIRTALILMLLVGVEQSLALGQTNNVAEEPAIQLRTGDETLVVPTKLLIYQPKYIPASETLTLVRELVGKDVHVVAEPVSNRLLIRASQLQIKEIEAVLETLDQPPKMVAFEVVFADFSVKAEDGQPAQAAQTSDEEWLARLKNPAGKGKGNVNKIRLTALDNQKAMVQYGEETPVVTGMQAFGRGGRSAITQQKQTGTIVQCTARVLDNETIIAEFEIERSRLAPPEDAAVLEESDDSGALRTPGQLTTTCKSTLILKPGKPRVISGLKSQGPKSGTQTVIVITAELVEPNN